MKKLLKITSIALSAIMLISAVTSVPVSAISQNDDFDGIVIDDVHVDKSLLKSVIRMCDFDGGGCFEKESYERYSQALENAYNILYSDTATQEEVDAAAKELQEASDSLIPAKFDFSKANHYYYLGKGIIENHKDEYLEEKFNKFKDAFFDLQAFLSCSTKTSQEEIDVEVEKFEAALVELGLDLSDCEAYLLAYDYIDLLAYDYRQPSVSIESHVGMPICTVSDYKIVPAYFNHVIAPGIDERFNGYIFHGYYHHTPACYGYIAVNVETGEIIALENALRNNIIDIDEFFECYRRNGATSSELFTMYLIGDCDNDGFLSVKDATELQRSLVNDKNLNNDGAFRENPNDVNNDHAVNILDVTEIQKIIVNS